MSQSSALSSTNAEKVVDLSINEQVARITLQNGKRHNTLTLPLLEQLNECFKIVAQNSTLKAVELRAEGKSFSTGGDLKGFSENLHQIEEYSHTLVGLLNDTMMRMFRLPIPIITKIHGPVTGGSFGLVLASDLIAMADDAFFAPYYVDVGFAPDGGWSVIFPERVGVHKAKSIQLLNQHIDSNTAVQLNIVDVVTSAESLENTITGWTNSVLSKVDHAVHCTKQTILSEEKLKEYENALEKERRNFIRLITTEKAQAGMAKFLQKFS